MAERKRTRRKPAQKKRAARPKAIPPLATAPLFAWIDKLMAQGQERDKEIIKLREHLAVQLSHNRRLIAEKEVLLKGNKELCKQLEDAWLHGTLRAFL